MSRWTDDARAGLWIDAWYAIGMAHRFLSRFCDVPALEVSSLMSAAKCVAYGEQAVAEMERQDRIDAAHEARRAS